MDYNVYMDLDPIISAECDDCGVSIILDASFISVVEFEGVFTGVTICSHCERPIITDIDKELVQELKEKGVNVLSWSEGEIEF
jgi:hypothetical protein